MKLTFDLMAAQERAQVLALINAVEGGLLTGAVEQVAPPAMPAAAPPAMPAAAPPAAAPTAMPGMPAAAPPAAGPTAMPGMPAAAPPAAGPTAMPGMPAAAPPAADPAIPGACPITTGPEFMKYVMDSYQILGAARGGQIQAVFGEFGCDHLNKITPEMYPAVWAKIENLKAQG